MTAQATGAQLERFQGQLTALFGLRFDDNRPSILAEVLARRSQERGLSLDQYLLALDDEDEASDETQALAREVTVGETYFFRHAEQFRAFEEVALPERLSARASSRQLRLLSAGCASGEEAYSLAILLRERGVEPAYAVSVHGIDVNRDALLRAQRATYSPWSLRETPAQLRERWFERDARNFQLARSLREAVHFARYNLASAAPPPFVAGSFDVVFCRNVLMYLTPEVAARAVLQLRSLLAPGGFLFLGHAETLRGLSHDFQLRHTHDTFYYQVKSQADLADAAGVQHAAAGATRGAPAASDAGWVDSWLRTVERSSERIRELSRPERAAVAASSLAPQARDLSQPLQLLRDDRFAEALELMRQPSTADDPAALLLRAALLAHQGDFASAQQACRDVLRLDDLNAGAHYLLALSCEGQGDARRAAEHDKTAIYLDAGFAMPHLHLGLMARRRHDTRAASEELQHALLLLEREDESRVLLFGGGFSRAALLALCRSELSTLKGRS